MHLLSALLLGLVAAPGVLAAGGDAYLPGSFRADVKHILHEQQRLLDLDDLSRREIGSNSVDFGSYWFSSAVAGGQAVEVLIDTGSADLYVLLGIS